MTDSPDSYFAYAEDTYHLILKEIEYAEKSPDLEAIFPKLIVDYLFFRQVRGEAFTSHRPPTPGDQQNNLYQMEREMEKRLEELGQRLTLTSDQTQVQLDQLNKLITSFYPVKT